MYKLLTVAAVLWLSGCATTSGLGKAEHAAHDTKIAEAASASVSSKHSGMTKYENNETGIDSIILNAALESFQTKYKEATFNKAFAQSVSGAWNWKSNRTSIEHAKTSALVGCQRNNKRSEDIYPCRVIHVNNSWVEPSPVSVPQQKQRPSKVESRPHVWSSHKELSVPVEACGQKAIDILNSLGFSGVTKSRYGEYIYGNYISSRAAVKCVPQEDNSFVYIVVAGSDIEDVENLRNEIFWQY